MSSHFGVSPISHIYIIYITDKVAWGFLWVYRYAFNLQSNNENYNDFEVQQQLWDIHKPQPDSQEPIALEGPWVLGGLI